MCSRKSIQDLQNVMFTEIVFTVNKPKNSVTGSGWNLEGKKRDDDADVLHVA